MMGLLGKKLGMTQLFGDDGKVVPVTVIDSRPRAMIPPSVTPQLPYPQQWQPVNQLEQVPARAFTVIGESENEG